MNAVKSGCDGCERILNSKATLQEVLGELTNLEKKVHSFVRVIILVGGLVGMGFLGVHLMSLMPASLHFVAWAAAGASIVVPLWIIKRIDVCFEGIAQKRIEKKDKESSDQQSGYYLRIKKRLKTDWCAFHKIEYTLSLANKKFLIG
jgi:hypothetical protein